MHRYLGKNYSNKSKLEAILIDFQKLVVELETLGIAHGDLQQGNILVKNDKLFLIDYDGMYLPALKNLKSNEIGHPNFQHPQRTGNHYNPQIDRFSSILIYLSLKALIYKPSLWSKYNNGDNIIIKKEDIGDLNSSAVVKELKELLIIKPLVDRFIGTCYLDFEKVPSLRDFISGNFGYDSSRIAKISVKGSQYVVLDAKSKGAILEHYGERVEVVGFITDYHRGETQYGKPYYFLNFGKYPSQSFKITVWSEAIKGLTDAGKSPASLDGKWISVIGVITSYGGKPQTVVQLPSQIQVLANEQEAKNKLNLKVVNIPPASAPKITSNPTSPVNSQKKVETEKEIFERLYGKFPTSKPIITPTQVKQPITNTSPVQPKPSTTSNQSINSTKSNSLNTTNSKTNDSGCIAPSICMCLGGIIGASITQNVVGFILGAVAGFVLYALFSK